MPSLGESCCVPSHDRLHAAPRARSRSYSTLTTTPGMKTPLYNALSGSTSTYLLQHATNPVLWQPWGDTAWEMARAEDKLVIVSIGYASCHWCHVMEHESFENDDVAALMNRHFVCIKVDREERPDVDHVYMDAVTMMSGHGGWPLNCFCLPDGRPVYGGTYFPRDRWMQVLRALADVYASDPERVRTSADEAMSILRQRAALPPARAHHLTSFPLISSIAAWQRAFDPDHGGDKRAPKFPMPCSLRFLLRSAEVFADTDAVDAAQIREHVHRTLTKMALGGIFDHVNGGFARYSTDERWKIPHFEKMLYDNAQLVSVYSEAYRASGDGFYARVVERTIAFLEETLRTPEGLFTAAMDADSEGEEGAYFVWSKEELARLLGTDMETFSHVYHIRYDEVFEHGKYVLHRSQTDEEAAMHCGCSVDELSSVLERCHERLREAQRSRVPPERDENIVCSWNALMVSAYVHAFRAFRREAYLLKARALFAALRTHAISADGTLRHICSRHTETPGFLEDHACMLQAAADVYAATGDGEVLAFAQTTIASVDALFAQADSPLYVFSSPGSSSLVLPTIEVYDNVIPSSNAVFARALYDMGVMTEREDLVRKAETMLGAVAERVCQYPSSFAHWAALLLDVTSNSVHMKVHGVGAREASEYLYHAYLPNVHVLRVPDATAKEPSNGSGGLRITVCDRNSCMPPVTSVADALETVRSVSLRR